MLGPFLRAGVLLIGLATGVALGSAEAVRAANIPGDLNVSQNVTAAGASSAMIPVPILPGAGGLEPKLVLSYSSQNGNTGVGLGWSLGGFSTITRGSKTREVDGAPGPIGFVNDDAFYLDGERLVPTGKLTGATAPSWLAAPHGAIAYRKVVDDGAVVFARLNAGGAIQDFVSESKSGLRTVFGKPLNGENTVTAETALPAPVAYLPTKTSDTAGNYILWTFDAEGLSYRLKSVDYTGLDGANAIAPFARIELAYSNARPIVTYLLGRRLERNLRLTSITSRHPNGTGAAAKGIALKLDYHETEKADAYYLKSAELKPFDDSLPLTTFKPLSLKNEWRQIGDLNLPILGGEVPTELTYKLGTASDLSGNPTQALFLSRISNGQLQAKTFVLTPARWVEAPGTQAPPLPFADAQGNTLHVVAVDLDDDGLSDLVQSDPAGKGVAWRQMHTTANPTADRWVRDAAHDDPGEAFFEADGAPRGFQLLDLDHANRRDLVVREASGRHVVLLNRSNGWARDDANFSFDVAADAPVVFGDVDCDKHDDRIQLVREGSDLVLQVFSGGSGGWTAKTTGAWQWKTSGQNSVAVRLLTVDKTKCRSLLVSVRGTTGSETLTVLQGSSGGWVEASVTAPGPLLFKADGSRLHPAIVDLDGADGDDIILSQNNSGGSALEATWRQSNRADAADPVVWVEDLALKPPTRIADADGPYADTVVAPWTYGGQKAAIVTLPSSRNAEGRVWLTAGVDWDQAADLAPTQPLVQGKQGGEFYRFVDLDGDGRQDLIYSDGVQNGAELNKPGGWVAAPQWIPARPLAKAGDAAARATLIDVNADGLVDLVYAYRAPDETVTEVRLNDRGVGWAAADTTWKPPAAMVDTQRGDLGWRFTDVNGDGRVDLLQSNIGQTFNLSAQAHLGTAQGWKSDAAFKPTVAFAFDAGNGRTLDLGTQLIDVDGDRLPDLVASYRDPVHPKNGTEKAGVFRNSGAGFSASPKGDVPVRLDAPYFDSASISWIDVDGDGNQDIIRFTETKGEVRLGNGYDWASSASQAWELPAAARSDKLGFGATRFVDMNGDGRVDILYLRPTERGVIVNTGVTWKENPQSVEPLDPNMPAFLTEAGDDAGVRMVDVTGHGALDLVKSAKAKKAGETADRATWRNPGQRQGMLDTVVESSGVRTVYTYVRLPDDPGTGEIFRRASSTAGSYPVIPLTPFSPVVGHTHMEEVSGRSVERDYTYADFAFDLELSRALGFRKVERNERASDSRERFFRTTEYRQDGHLAGRPAIEEASIDTGGGRVVVERTTKDWDVARWTAAPNPRGGTFAFLQLVITKSATETHGLDGTLTGQMVTELQYDGWLNATKAIVTKPGRAQQVTDNLFGEAGDDPFYARYGRLTRATVTVTDLASAKVASSRTATFTYEPDTYLTKSETLDVGDQELGFSKTYVRNARGATTSTTHKATSGVRRARGGGAPVAAGQSRVSRTEYDTATLRLVTAEINAKGHRTELAYGPGSIGEALGLSTAETDPNGIAAAKSVDALGRAATLTGPDGVVHSVERILGAQVPTEWIDGAPLKARAMGAKRTGVKGRGAKGLIRAPTTPTMAANLVAHAEVRRVKAPGGATRLERAELLDRQGHVLRTITPRTDGTQTRLAFKDFRYDVRGRLAGETAPYFAGETAYWTTYGYDGLNRRTSETRPNTGVATVAYRDLQQISTNARGHATIITRNLDGKPVRIERADKGVVKLAYDAMERVESVTSAKGFATTYRYDAIGNRTYTADPNTGPLEYRYDGFGQLREERAGGQQWAELDYDELGRPKRVWREDQETLYTYDGTDAIGRPEKVTLTRQNGGGTLQFTESYEYDGALRLRRTTTALATPGTVDPAFDTNFRGVYTFEYEAFGQLGKVYYPRSGPQPGLVVEREYDADTGQLRRVLDARTGAKTAALWRMTRADAAGRSREVAFGNKTREVREYKATTGRLEKMQVFSSTNALLLETGYDYDLMGNLKSRGSAGKPEEVFDYDVQNHLVRFIRKGPGATDVKVTYDEDDRITFKTGIGAYHYASDGNARDFCQRLDLPPHALCATDKNGVVTRLFDYDAFGSLKTRKDPSQDDLGLQVDYTFDRHVARITKLGERGIPDNRTTAEFYYGPSGQRILSREMNPEGGLCAAHRSKETVHMGLFERITVKHGCMGGSRLVTDRAYVQAEGGVFLALDLIDRSNALGSEKTGRLVQQLYQHRDQLNSVVMISRDDGKVGARVRYDPWGKAAGDLNPHNDHDNDLKTEAAWTRGFTGQDHVAEFDVVHMTGRVYDPELGVFLSVDPLGADPASGGDLNPYLYAQGNPLAITDPSGLWGIGDIGRAIGDAVSGIGRAIDDAAHWVGHQLEDLYHGAEKWVGENWREIVTVVVIIAVTAVTAGAAGPVVAAMAAGAAGAMTQTALYGGSVSDVIAAGVVGGAIGLISGGIGASGWSWQTKALVQGFVSGVHSQATGRGFEKGFWIGALSRVPTGVIADGQTNWSAAGRVVTRAALNGAISQMQGEKFETAAIFGLLSQSWAEDKNGRVGVRSWLQTNIGFLAPGTPGAFAKSDLIDIYIMVSDMHADRGVHQSAIQGEPNEFIDKVKDHYNKWMGQGVQVQSVRSDPAMSGRDGSPAPAGALWQRSSDGDPASRRRRPSRTRGAARRRACFGEPLRPNRSRRAA